MMLLVGLHVRGQRRGCVVAPRASCALVRLLRVVRLHVDLQVVAGKWKIRSEPRDGKDDPAAFAIKSRLS